MTPLSALDELRDRLGPVGVWANTHHLRPMPWAEERSYVQRIEAADYGSIWSGELLGGKEVFAHHALILGATSHIVVGTGIANVWCRHPAAMEGGGATLAEAFPGRFVLGIGISHRAVVERSGLEYPPPLAHMRRYLEDMAASAPMAPAPAVQPRVLAAVGPKMLALAAEVADGAHPYFIPFEHTATARDILGPDKLLVPEVPVVLDADRTSAWATARAHIGPVLQQSSLAYVENLRRFGYTDDDLADGGSDRLLESLFAAGDEAAIVARVQDHLDTGADHVLLNPVAADMNGVVEILERLQPALADLKRPIRP